MLQDPNLSGRAMFDAELSRIARIELDDPDSKIMKWVAPIAPPKPEKLKKPRPISPKQLARAENHRRAWDMIGAGNSSAAVVAACFGMRLKTISGYMDSGRPDGADWYEVRPEDFTADQMGANKRATFAAIMNRAARRWQCPARVLFGRQSQRLARGRTFAGARAEVCFILRTEYGLSFPRVGAILRLNHASVLHACRRVQTRPEFAYLREGRL